MAPIAIEPIDPKIKDVVVPKKDTLTLPETARARLEKAGIVSYILDSLRVG